MRRKLGAIAIIVLYSLLQMFRAANPVLLARGIKIAGGAFSSRRGRYQTEDMASSLPIGDFSRATHMSIKTLRHYHRVGLLEPADVAAELTARGEATKARTLRVMVPVSMRSKGRIDVSAAASTPTARRTASPPISRCPSTR